MDALDADPLGGAVGVLFVQRYFNRALADQRMIKLRNLIALRQVSVKIVFAVETRPFVDDRAHGHAGSHRLPDAFRSEEHTSELQSLMRTSYAVFCLKKKKKNKTQ